MLSSFKYLTTPLNHQYYQKLIYINLDDDVTKLWDENHRSSPFYFFRAVDYKFITKYCHAWMIKFILTQLHHQLIKQIIISFYKLYITTEKIEAT